MDFDSAVPVSHSYHRRRDRRKEILRVTKADFRNLLRVNAVPKISRSMDVSKFTA